MITLGKMKNCMRNRPLWHWAELLGIAVAAIILALVIGVLAMSALAFGAEVDPITIVRPWWQELAPSAVLVAIIIAMWRRIGHMRDNDVKHIHQEVSGVRADIKREFDTLKGDIKDVVKKIDRHLDYHLWTASGGQAPPEKE